MVTKDMIRAEIDRLDQSKVDEAYRILKDLTIRSEAPRGTLSRLKSVEIDGPRDFSENLDLYLSGVKDV